MHVYSIVPGPLKGQLGGLQWCVKIKRRNEKWGFVDFEIENIFCHSKLWWISLFPTAVRTQILLFKWKYRNLGEILIFSVKFFELYNWQYLLIVFIFLFFGAYLESSFMTSVTPVLACFWSISGIRSILTEADGEVLSNSESIRVSRG